MYNGTTCESKVYTALHFSSFLEKYSKVHTLCSPLHVHWFSLDISLTYRFSLDISLTSYIIILQKFRLSGYSWEFTYTGRHCEKINNLMILLPVCFDQRKLGILYNKQNFRMYLPEIVLVNIMKKCTFERY